MEFKTSRLKLKMFLHIHTQYINTHSGGLNLRLKCVKKLGGGYSFKVVALKEKKVHAATAYNCELK